MARRLKNAHAGLPTKEAVLAFLKEHKGKVGKREIARAFGIGGGDRIYLKQLLKDLEDEGLVDRRRNRVHMAGALPPVVLADVIARDDDGDLIAEPAEWADEDSAPPHILIVPPQRARPGQPAPGQSDRVLLRVEARVGDEPGPAYVGRVIKIIEKSRARTLGIFRALPAGGGRIVPVDKRAQGRELAVPPGDEGEAQDGDLVSVTVARAPRIGLPSAKVRERLGSLRSERAVSLIAIHAHGIPHVFSKAALAEAEAALPATLDGREDWRDLPLITIDPADAKDHDDAVHAAPDGDPNNPGGFLLTIAIADVAAYVRPGTALDREALQRGNSVYFPDRVVPMLPERISNDLCSLRPAEDRPALAVRIAIGADGRKLGHRFHRIMMRSAAKLSYPQAQAAIDGSPDDATAPLLDDVLRPLWAAYEAVKQARDAREPLDLDLPERKILLKPDGTVDRVIVPERLAAHRLIEEFMILANVAAAETLEKAQTPLVYRVHDEPSLEKLRALGEVLASVGIKAPKSGALRPALFNRILRMVRGTEHETFVNEIVLRTQAQAEYAAENYGHFGLSLRRYAHFTSPIRRYADLVVHRALIRAQRLGSDGLHADATREQLAEVAAQISTSERRAMAAERETIDRLIAHHLADQVGSVFRGQVSGVTKAGLFVKLDETGADGFVPAATIGADYYRYVEEMHALVGERSGETFRLGDKVEVMLAEAAPVAGALRFEMVSEGRAGRPPRGRRAAPARREPRGRKGPTKVRVRTGRNTGKGEAPWDPRD